MHIYLTAVTTLLGDRQFMASPLGKSTVWSNLSTYMEKRALAKAALDMPGNTDDAKRAVRATWAEWQAGYRDTSLLFSDFFDSYLALDDLTLEVPNG
jgi:hypothetical protein